MQHIPHLQGDAALTIASFGSSVSVLNSKTRPKKLVIVASDGVRHSFLLKVRAPLEVPCAYSLRDCFLSLGGWREWGRGVTEFLGQF